jgi:hypothetical protein
MKNIGKIFVNKKNKNKYIILDIIKIKHSVTREWVDGYLSRIHILDIFPQ